MPVSHNRTHRSARAIRRQAAAAEKAGKTFRMTPEAAEIVTIADDVAEGLSNLSTDYLRKKCKSVKDDNDHRHLGACVVRARRPASPKCAC